LYDVHSGWLSPSRSVSSHAWGYRWHGDYQYGKHPTPKVIIMMMIMIIIMMMIIIILMIIIIMMMIIIIMMMTMRMMQPHWFVCIRLIIHDRCISVYVDMDKASLLHLLYSSIYVLKWVNINAYISHRLLNRCNLKPPVHLSSSPLFIYVCIYVCMYVYNSIYIYICILLPSWLWILLYSASLLFIGHWFLIVIAIFCIYAFLAGLYANIWCRLLSPSFVICISKHHHHPL
jgi:hypothetical protein